MFWLISTCLAVQYLTSKAKHLTVAQNALNKMLCNTSLSKVYSLIGLEGLTEKVLSWLRCIVFVIPVAHMFPLPPICVHVFVCVFDLALGLRTLVSGPQLCTDLLLFGPPTRSNSWPSVLLILFSYYSRSSRLLHVFMSLCVPFLPSPLVSPRHSESAAISGSLLSPESNRWLGVPRASLTCSSLIQHTLSFYIYRLHPVVKLSEVQWCSNLAQQLHRSDTNSEISLSHFFFPTSNRRRFQSFSIVSITSQLLLWLKRERCSCDGKEKWLLLRNRSYYELKTMMPQEISVNAAIVLSELDGIFTLRQHKNSTAQDLFSLTRDATIRILQATHLLRSQEAASAGETLNIQQANQPIPNRKFHDTSQWIATCFSFNYSLICNCNWHYFNFICVILLLMSDIYSIFLTVTG